MIKKIVFGLSIIAVIAIAIYEGLPERVMTWWNGGQQVATLLDRVRSEHGLPDPLFGPLDAISSHLSVSGVVEETNKHRAQQGLLPLSIDSELQLAAERKLDDMFAQQYFAHESPDGLQPADVISAAGYEYLVVGENLALGNYKDDATLVQAWMDSPGHRANILSQKFSEIGVAVKKAEYEGREVWMAVQEFGTPLTACPTVAKDLLNQINANQAKIATEESALEQRRATLKPQNYESQAEYNRAVNSYNRDVQELNRLINSTKQLVNEYNQRVNEFNKCLENNA